MKFFSTPAYSFGLKPKGNQNQGSNIGPGDYDVTKGYKNTQHQFAAYTIGRAEREDKKHMEAVPGPGHYNTGASTMNGGSKIGKARRQDMGGQEGPGPGSYNPKMHSKTAPQYSLGRSERKGMDQGGSALGPGAYNLKGSEQAPLGKFGKSTRGDDHQFVNQVGPGQYNTHQSTLSTKAGAFGRQNRDFKGKDEATSGIGPGAYNVAKQGAFNTKGGCTMGRRYKTHDTGDTPGPGQYAKSYKGASKS